jgi:TRAP-type C4-dicarboxylate transport system substrate-binding protein
MYTALATGTVDAQESGLPLTYSYKVYEQHKYCALTAHQCGILLMNINNKFWKSLTAMQRKTIQNAADKCTKLVAKGTIEEDKRCYQLLVKEGMKFTKPNRALFREKGKTIWNQYGDPELLKKIELIK